MYTADESVFKKSAPSLKNILLSGYRNAVVEFTSICVSDASTWEKSGLIENSKLFYDISYIPFKENSKSVLSVLR